MLFSLLKHYLDLYINDTALIISRSLYCFTTLYLMVLKLFPQADAIFRLLQNFTNIQHEAIFIFIFMQIIGYVLYICKVHLIFACLTLLNVPCGTLACIQGRGKRECVRRLLHFLLLIVQQPLRILFKFSTSMQ